MSGLQSLIDRCEIEVCVQANPHRYEQVTVAQYIEDRDGQYKLGIDGTDYEAMVNSDMIICLHFYPIKLTESYCLYGINVDDLVKSAHEILDSEP